MAPKTRRVTLKRQKDEPETKTINPAELGAKEYDKVLSRIMDDEDMTEEAAARALGSHSVRVVYDGKEIDSIKLVRKGGSRLNKKTRGTKRGRRHSIRR